MRRAVGEALKYGYVKHVVKCLGNVQTKESLRARAAVWVQEVFVYLHYDVLGGEVRAIP